MQVILGICIGGILTVILFPILIQPILLILWGLGFIDMGLHSTTPDWLKRIKTKLRIK